MFRLPKSDPGRQTWIDALPPRADINTQTATIFVCERHWPTDAQFHITPGGHSKPSGPPSVFDVPPSCLPIPKPKPRTTNEPDAQLRYFLECDRISDYDSFHPESDLSKKYSNNVIFFQRNADSLKCTFLSSNLESVLILVTVFNRKTTTSPLTLTITKQGFRVPLKKLLNPNNGLTSVSQFFDCVHNALIHEISLSERLELVASSVENCIEHATDERIEGTRARPG